MNQASAWTEDVHHQIMLANHPDRGELPYMVSKINGAKHLIEKTWKAVIRLSTS